MRSRLKAIVAMLCTVVLVISPTSAAWGDDDNDASSGVMTASEQDYKVVEGGKRIDKFKLNNMYSYESLGNDSGKPTLTLSASNLQRAVKEKLLPQWSALAASVFRDQADQLVDLYGYQNSGGNMSKAGFDAYFNMGKGGAPTEYKSEEWSCYNLSSKLGQTFASHAGDPGWDQFTVSGVKQINSLSEARNMVGQSLYDCENHKGLRADEFLSVTEGNNGEARLDALDDDGQTTGFANVVTSINCKGASADFDYVTFGIVFYDFEPVPVAAKNLNYIAGNFTTETIPKGGQPSEITNAQQQDIVHSALLGDSVTETTSTTLSGLSSFKMSENIGANIGWSETESESETEFWGDDDSAGASTSTSSETTSMGLNWGTAWEMAGALGAEVGHSKSVELSKAVETTIALPPHTATTIEHNASTTAYTQTYQQPAILNNKVALFAVTGDFYSGGGGGINPSRYDKQSLVIKFNTKDEITPFYGCTATDDLFSRTNTNINVQGYDVSNGRTYSTHSTASGWNKSNDIDWASVMSTAQNYYGFDVANNLAKKNFFFESQGKLSVDKDKVSSSAQSIRPLYDLASVKTSKTNYVLYSNNTLDYDALAVQGYNKFDVPFYGFTSDLGEWQRCDAQGNLVNGGNLYDETNPDPATNQPDPAVTKEENLVPRTGTNGGTMYFRWVANPEKKPITNESPTGQDLTNSNIKSPVVTIKVVNVGLDNPQVTAEGGYIGYYKTPLNLNDVITWEVTDSDDMIIIPQVYWEAREQNTGDITVRAGTGDVTFAKPGEYKVRPYVINNNAKKVYPGWITITATEHNLVHYDAKAPACDTDGWIEHYRCSDCGKYFSDAKGSTEIPAANVFVAATGHDWGEWTATDTPGKQQRVCKTDASHKEERDLYTVQFNMNGHGTTPESQSFTSDVVASVSLPPEPTAAGYTFEGWFYDENCTTPYDSAAVTGNLTLYAKWSPVKYTVATIAVGDLYVGEDGEEKIRPDVHGTLGIEGSEGEVKTATETEDGYTYTYYYKEVEYGESVTLTATPQTNYALRKIQAVPVNSVSSTGDISTGEPFTPDKMNDATYSFTMPAADVAVVASFAQEKVKVEYNGNEPQGVIAGAQIVPGPETIAYGSAPGQIDTVLTLDGYVFGGWFTDQACTKPCLKTAAITQDTMLYAKWTVESAPPHTVTYTLLYDRDPNDPSDTGSYSESYKIEGDTSTAYNPTEDLYTVAGKDLTAAYELQQDTQSGSCWFTDEDCTAAYDFEAPVTGDLNLYAKVVPRTYTVTYFDGEQNLGTQDVAYNTAIGTLGITAPTKDGCTLSGWLSKGADWSIESDPVTSKLNLYTSWTVNKYSVSFDANGQGTAPTAQSVAYEMRATEPASPTADGYSFGGWFADKACTEAYDFSTPVKGDITLYAKWTQDLIDISKAKVTLAQTSFDYDGTAKEPAVQSVVLDDKTLNAGEDFTVSYKDNVNAGTATVTITGTSSYTGSAFATFTIADSDASKTSIAKAKVTLAKRNYTYDGKAKKPAVKSVVLNGKTLKAGTDYAVSYSKNVKLGTAIATINGIGLYKGSVNATFEIGLGKPKLSTIVHVGSNNFLKAKWAKVAGAAKYQLQYRVSGGKWKTVSLKSISKNLKGMKSGKLYDVRVRAVSGKVKSAWSSVNHRWFMLLDNVSAKSTSVGTVKASWKKVSKANAGYQVLVRYTKNGPIVAKVNVKAGKTATIVKGLVPGKKAWVEVRALRKAGNTTYSGELTRAKSAIKVASK